MYHLNNHPNFGYLKSHMILMKDICHDLNSFLKECNKHATALGKSISKENFSVYGFNFYEMRWFNKKTKSVKFDELSNAIKNKFMGDVMEIFAAFFLQYFETDPIFGAKRGTFQFTNDNKDFGCDGSYINTTSGGGSFIQVKYRSDPHDRPFDYPAYAKLNTDAEFNYGYNRDDKTQRLVFFTNIPVGTNINEWTARTGPFNKFFEKMLVKPILIGKNEIEKLTGDSHSSNKTFWNEFYSQFE